MASVAMSVGVAALYLISGAFATPMPTPTTPMPAIIAAPELEPPFIMGPAIDPGMAMITPAPDPFVNLAAQQAVRATITVNGIEILVFAQDASLIAPLETIISSLCATDALEFSEICIPSTPPTTFPTTAPTTTPTTTTSAPEVTTTTEVTETDIVTQTTTVTVTSLSISVIVTTLPTVVRKRAEATPVARDVARAAEKEDLIKNAVQENILAKRIEAAALDALEEDALVTSTTTTSSTSFITTTTTVTSTSTFITIVPTLIPVLRAAKRAELVAAAPQDADKKHSSSVSLPSLAPAGPFLPPIASSIASVPGVIIQTVTSLVTVGGQTPTTTNNLPMIEATFGFKINSLNSNNNKAVAGDAPCPPELAEANAKREEAAAEEPVPLPARLASLLTLKKPVAPGKSVKTPVADAAVAAA